MKVSKIELCNYKNIQRSVVFPDPGVNVIFGDNAQGKTNFLESLWLFTGNKSFRNTKDLDQINFSQKECTLSIGFSLDCREKISTIKISEEKKEVTINSVKQKSFSALLGVFRAVIFSPDHLTLVKGNPLERRKFMDLSICQIKPVYAKILSLYNKTLLQRNSLLKDIFYHPNLLETLDVWDEKLAKLAANIFRYRQRFVFLFRDCAKDLYSGISKQKELLDVVYQTSFCFNDGMSEEAVYENFLRLLKQSQKQDIKAGFTTVGPHRDDLEFFVDNKLAKTFASQGQQRSIVLSAKLAEATILKNVTGNSPIVLLDDVLSELDSSRQDFLLNKIKSWQVFITCCESTPAVKLASGKSFHVYDGKITPVQEV